MATINARFLECRSCWLFGEVWLMSHHMILLLLLLLLLLLVHWELVGGQLWSRQHCMFELRSDSKTSNCCNQYNIATVCCILHSLYTGYILIYRLYESFLVNIVGNVLRIMVCG